MKIAIIYSTSNKITKKAAKILQDKLDFSTQLIPIEKAKAACLLKYNFIILGGSVNNGKVQGELKLFVSRNIRTLKERPTAIFINSIDNENPEKVFSKELVDSSYIFCNFGDEINLEEGSFFEKRAKNNLISKYEKEGKKLPKLNLDNIDKFASYVNNKIKGI